MAAPRWALEIDSWEESSLWGRLAALMLSCHGTSDYKVFLIQPLLTTLFISCLLSSLYWNPLCSHNDFLTWIRAPSVPHPSHYISFPLLLLLLMTQLPISALPSFLPQCFPASVPFSLTLYVPDGYFLKPEGPKDARSISECNGALPWSLFPSWDKRSWELILLMHGKYMLF